jgi:hypothetical protein
MRVRTALVLAGAVLSAACGQPSPTEPLEAHHARRDGLPAIGSGNVVQPPLADGPAIGSGN